MQNETETATREILDQNTDLQSKVHQLEEELELKRVDL